MDDTVLADEIIARLNRLLENPDVRTDIARLIESRVECSITTANHPTIQTGDGGRLGVLGLLNGLVGVIGTGSKASWGHITAEFDDDTELVRFVRTVSAPK